MGNLLQATVTIKGTRPLWWHHFGDDAIPLEKGERTGVAGNDPEEWRRTVLVDGVGQLYLEPTYIFGTLKEGARFTKKGKGSIQADLCSTLQVLDDRVMVDRYLPDGNGHGELTRDANQPVYLDVRMVKNPSTKARNVRYRIAASRGWQATFQILWDKTIVPRAQVQATIVDAGRLSGLGSGRSIGYGRFDVVSVDIQDA